jgi:hypothetical protein
MKTNKDLLKRSTEATGAAQEGTEKLLRLDLTEASRLHRVAPRKAYDYLGQLLSNSSRSLMLMLTVQAAVGCAGGSKVPSPGH